MGLAVTMPPSPVEAVETGDPAQRITTLLPHHADDAICTSAWHAAVASPRVETRLAALPQPRALPEESRDVGGVGSDRDVARWCLAHSTTSSIH
jgi:hypothetical protein